MGVNLICVVFNQIITAILCNRMDLTSESMNSFAKWLRPLSWNYLYAVLFMLFLYPMLHVPITRDFDFKRKDLWLHA